MSYQASRKMSVDVGYTRIFVSDGAVQLAAGTGAADPNLTRGNLNGTIQAAINILGAQVRYTF